MIHWPASRMLALSQRFIETVLLLLCELKHKNRLQCRTLSLSEIPRMRLKTDRVSPDCVSAAIGLFNNRVKCVHVGLWFLVEPGSHLSAVSCTLCIPAAASHFSHLLHFVVAPSLQLIGQKFQLDEWNKEGTSARRVHDERTSSLAAYRRGWQVEPLLKVL